jgi:DNA polymerase-3 subunit delta'
MVIGHKKQKEFLKKKFESEQLSHAYLFTGSNGIGKKTFALEFVESIGCKFPDLMMVEPDESKEISIKKIREVQNFLAYKSYNGGVKTVIVDQAEKMNAEAQNCFLKTLEEPKGNTLIILVSSKPDLFLPTIASRCQILKFFRPKDLPINSEKVRQEKETLEKLVPVINANLSEKFKYAKEFDFDNQDFGETLEILQRSFRDLLLEKAGAEASKSVLPGKKYSVSQVKNILNLIDSISNKLLFTNASPKLALEILLMEL